MAESIDMVVLDAMEKKIDILQQKLERVLAITKELDEFMGDPDETLALAEGVYAEKRNPIGLTISIGNIETLLMMPVNDIDLEAVADIKECLRNFYQSRLLKQLCKITQKKTHEVDVKNGSVGSIRRICDELLEEYDG
jgi:hypothetical protein